MRRVRQKNTAAEQKVAEDLRKLGLAYRKNVKGLPGAPDFANRIKRWAVFVQGCFWHHHKGCVRATIPKANRSFWVDKFQRNRARDAKALKALRRAGFRVILIWECELDAAPTKLGKILEARRIEVGEPLDH